MTILADVSVLLALAWPQHTAHARARAWWDGLDQGDTLATCAITELGFVRISMQGAVVAADIAGAKRALDHLRTARPGHTLLPDTLGADALPAWVNTAAKTTDGHLVALAEAHGAQLVTLDKGIPGAKLIP